MGNDKHHTEKEKQRACERDKKHVREKEQSHSKNRGGAVVVYGERNDKHHREREKQRACEREKKHVREKEQSHSKNRGGAVVVSERERKHVKEESRYSYHVYEKRESKEEQVVLQVGKDVFVLGKATVKREERVTKIKEPGLRIDERTVRVEYKVPSSLPAAFHGHRRLLLK